MKIYGNPTSNFNLTTLLRKLPSKFDVIRQHSNTNPRYKNCAATCYSRKISTLVSPRHERYRQVVLSKTILSYKGYSIKTLDTIFRQNHQTRPKKALSRRFLCTIPFDNVSRIHYHLKRLLISSNFPFDDFFLPVDTPQSKLRSYITTNRKLVKRLWNQDSNSHLNIEVYINF